MRLRDKITKISFYGTRMTRILKSVKISLIRVIRVQNNNETDLMDLRGYGTRHRIELGE